MLSRFNRPINADSALTNFAQSLNSLGNVWSVAVVILLADYARR